MESFQRVQSMIQEARQWLDKAEGSYKSANPIRGELDLHLAQAEIQRACEASRAICFGPQHKETIVKREQSSSRVRYYTIGTAAAVIGFMFFASLSLFLYVGGSTMRNRSLMGASFKIQPIFIYISDTQGNAAEKQTTPTVTKNSTQNEKNPRLVAVKPVINQNIEAVSRKNSNADFTDYDDPEIQADAPDFSRLYAVPNSRGNQWHAATTTHWGEDRIIRNSVPSFSRNISNEGGR